MDAEPSALRIATEGMRHKPKEKQMGIFSKNRRRIHGLHEPEYTAPPPDQQSDPSPEPASPEPAPVTDAAAPLDFSLPVRTITTKQPVEILTTRARHPVYQVHAYIGNDVTVTVFTAEGRLSENGPLFLENVPAKEELFINIYPNRDPRSPQKYAVTNHATQHDADLVSLNRLACVRIEFEL